MASAGLHGYCDRRPVRHPLAPAWSYSYLPLLPKARGSRSRALVCWTPVTTVVGRDSHTYSLSCARTQPVAAPGAELPERAQDDLLRAPYTIVVLLLFIPGESYLCRPFQDVEGRTQGHPLIHFGYAFPNTTQQREASRNQKREARKPLKQNAARTLICGPGRTYNRAS